MCVLVDSQVEGFQTGEFGGDDGPDFGVGEAGDLVGGGGPADGEGEAEVR